VPINANVSGGSQITASVGETKIDVSVSGGFGPSGAAGPAASVTVGTVTTGSPGSSASVVNAGSSSAVVLNFTIPAGATGATGSQGPPGTAGVAGETGPMPYNYRGEWDNFTNYSLYDAVTFDGGLWWLPATGGWTIGGAPPGYNWQLLVAKGATGSTGPQGERGEQGIQGIQGIQGPAGATGPAGQTGPAGTTTWAGITDKPSTFTPSTHAHVAADISDFTSAVIAAAPPTTNASLLTSGTLADARLSANVVLTGDSRLTDSREWSADTITQAEAEAGTATTRRAFTALRVFQAIAAWWNASAAKTKLDGIATAATANATDAQLRDRATHTGTQAAGTITGLATVATSGAYADLTGRPTIPAAYTLSAATDSVLGGVRIGSGITIDGNGVISASSGYTLPSATTSTLGGVIVGEGLSVSSGTVSANLTSVAGRTGAVTLARGDVGLGNVDNTSDAGKPVSTATQTALDLKAAASHTHTLSSLTQSGATDGQVPQWSGSAWVAATPTSTSGGSSSRSLLFLLR